MAEARGVCEPDQVRDQLGGHPCAGQLSDLLVPEPGQPCVGCERKLSVTKELKPTAGTPQFAGHTFYPIPRMSGHKDQVLKGTLWRAVRAGWGCSSHTD